MLKIGGWYHATVDNYGENVQLIEDRSGETARYKVRNEAGKEYYVWTHELGPYDSRRDTLKHIEMVRARLDEMIGELQDRQRGHDASKLVEPEKSGYDRLTGALRGARRDGVYVGSEYLAAITDAHDAIQHHYAKNPHHPEHYPDGIAGMTLADLVEMLADWKAASERDGTLSALMGSLEGNIRRWNIDPQLGQILANTIREMEW